MESFIDPKKKAKKSNLVNYKSTLLFIFIFSIHQSKFFASFLPHLSTAFCFINMDHKPLLRLLLLLLACSFVLSRNLKATSLEGSLSVGQDLRTQSFSRVLLEENESSFIEGKMDIERTDYSGTGANPHHDPKPPGSV
ncbi:hypothetical protein ACH5RR_025133 [Cinchona calisaya]|uniref:Uncharacterized protein n=1 Tax=Cinchona calisaya TaxID=153742 RepID=A0ABD2YZG0_9GENT